MQGIQREITHTHTLRCKHYPAMRDKRQESHSACHWLNSSSAPPLCPPTFCSYGSLHSYWLLYTSGRAAGIVFYWLSLYVSHGYFDNSDRPVVFPRVPIGYCIRRRALIGQAVQLLVVHSPFCDCSGKGTRRVFFPSVPSASEFL